MSTPKKKAIYFKILNYTEPNLALLESYFDVTHLNTPAELTAELLADVCLIFAPLGYTFDGELFAAAPALQCIASNTTSEPHIDTRAAQAAGIEVFSLKRETAFLATITPTSEMTIALMLMITRNIVPAIESVKQGRWCRWDYGGQAMLSRLQLGIVGMGRLGRLVSQAAAALGMKIRFYDPYVDQHEAPLYEKFDTLLDMVAGADVVSLHAHATDETRGMIDRNVLAGFKDGAYLINTARGDLVDAAALVEALQSRKIAGAAVDVLDGEFEPSFQHNMLEHPLVKYSRTRDNLLITPHIAGSTQDAWHLTQRHVIKKSINFIYDLQLEQ